MEKVDKNGPNGCWVWSAATAKGYGVFSFNANGTTILVGAHRVAWDLFRGFILGDLDVLHTCDNPPCVNPDHLFLGTAIDNAIDMIAKGRGRHEAHPGESNALAKLTDEAVREIRSTLAQPVPLGTRAMLAKRFGVSRTAITYVAHGKTWKHISIGDHKL